MSQDIAQVDSWGEVESHDKASSGDRWFLWEDMEKSKMTSPVADPPHHEGENAIQPV